MRELVWIVEEPGLDDCLRLAKCFKNIYVDSRVLSARELYEVISKNKKDAELLPTLVIFGDSIPSPLKAALRKWRASFIAQEKKIFPLFIIVSKPEGKHESVQRNLDEFTIDYYVQRVETLFGPTVLKNYIRKATDARELARSDAHIGNSPAMQAVKAKIERVKDIDSTVLITGKSGTGKELVAKEIHRRGSRSPHPMVAINCAAYPDTLLESELFGYDKGAFTGAYQSGRKGLLETAGKGTVFLDEVSEMSIPSQAKLLRVIQEREFHHLGSSQTLKLSARIIAATNRDLQECVRNGSFRDDLFYRLNVIPIEVPPLRERVEDIPLLIWYFGMRLASKYNVEFKKCDEDVLEILMRYEWPGNVRELHNMLERCYVLGTGNEIIYGDLDKEIIKWNENKERGLSTSDGSLPSSSQRSKEPKGFDFYNADHMALLKKALLELKGNPKKTGTRLTEEHGFLGMRSGAAIKNRAGLDKANMRNFIPEFAEWYSENFPRKRSDKMLGHQSDNPAVGS